MAGTAGSGGRRRSARSLAPPVAVIGFDFGGTKIEVALADRSGQLLERSRLETRPELGPEQSIRRAAAVAGEMAGRAAARHGSHVVAHAAVSPGVIHAEGVLLAPNMHGWEDLPFAERLAEELGVETVVVGNDVQAGALAEARAGALVGFDPAVYVSLGTGLAAVLVIGSRVVEGAHRAAGEIGYTSLDLTSRPVSGATPLEDLVGGKALAQRASVALERTIDTAELFTLAEPAAEGLVQEALDALAGALANLSLFVDPARIAVGGGMMAAGARILPVLRARLTETVLFPPEVVAARYLIDASLHGAIAMALDAAQEVVA